MSLILEALKKSEQQRRLGEAPNLGTPIVLTRRRRSLLPVLAAAIAIALGAGWYLLRDKPGATPDDAKVASTSPEQTARHAAASAIRLSTLRAASPPASMLMLSSWKPSGSVSITPSSTLSASTSCITTV